jgi:hypothetical protein
MARQIPFLGDWRAWHCPDQDPGHAGVAEGNLYERKILMSTLAKYITDIVEATFTDFEQDKTPRRAFIAAVVAYHAIDRAAKRSRKTDSRKYTKGLGAQHRRRSIW